MALQVPIGIDDFRTLREEGLEYVDKSLLICGLIDQGGVQAVLLPRPRRFGKSLNLSMLRCFFEKRDEDLSHLFADLAVWGAGDAYRAHFQRYPVIYLNFKDVKFERSEDAWWTIREKLRDLFRAHRVVLDSGGLDEVESERFRSILDGSAPPILYHRALQDLSEYLHRHHGERVVILIDEYDQPIHAGYTGGYVREMLDFFRAFLGSGLKGNPHLFKAVLTGILRVARESIFSGLNNLRVYSLLHPKFATAFGFTEAEVAALLERAGLRERLDEVQAWYDGYVFGGEVIYNPWSVLSYVADAESRMAPQPYWLATSSNDLIRHVLEIRAARLQPLFGALLAGEGIERTIDENVVLDALETDDDALWSLLVFAGYLRPELLPRGAGDRDRYRLTIPNREVRLVYADTFRRWIKARMQAHGGDLDALTHALLGGDAAGLERQLGALARDLLSYHDAGTPAPENLYHGFMLGLLAVLEPAYRVRSNRESGQGRPDVMISPARPGQPGVLLELKVARAGEKTLETALAEGLAQLANRGYEAELRAAGAEPIHAFAIAFDGKDVRVRASP
jgi:Predicted AAA-ATPase/PD-(D/E)XK nuclease superfamily